MAQIGFISLIGVIRVIYIHIYQHCQSFNATVNTNRSFTCNINYVIGEAILFIWLHTHHNPLSRLPYRPHNQLYLSRHIGTAAQATAHLLQLLPEVRIIVNPILQLTVSNLRKMCIRDRISAHTAGSGRARAGSPRTRDSRWWRLSGSPLPSPPPPTGNPAGTC